MVDLGFFARVRGFRALPRVARAHAGLALLSLMSACGGRAPTAPPVPQRAAVSEPDLERSFPVHQRGGQKIVAEVGEAGGTLELDNGARLDIPKGALSEPVTLTFAAGARTTAFSNREYERALGPTLEIAPALVLGTPLSVSVPLAELPEGFAPDDLALGVEVAADLQRLGAQGTQTRWDYMDATTQHGRMAASLTRLSGMRVQFIVSKSQ